MTNCQSQIPCGVFWWSPRGMPVLSLGFKGLAWISSCYRFDNGGGRIHVCMESSMFWALLFLYVFSLCTNQFAHQFVSPIHRSHDVKIDKRVSMVLATLSLASCLIAHLSSQGMGALRLGWSPTSCAQVKGGKYHTWVTFATYHYSPKQCQWRKVMQKGDMEIC